MPLLERVIRYADRLLPAPVMTGARFFHYRNISRKRLRESGRAAATLQFVQAYGTKVLAGPFAGMEYPRDSVLAREGIPLLLGTYEMELHETVNSWVNGRYQAVINVGSADGYYAVGLARLLAIPVHAFDAEFRERRYCHRMAALNGVAHLMRIANWCSAATIQRLALGQRFLVVSDCEGYETQLFTEDAVQSLRDSDILVEIHEIEGVDVEALLRERLMSSHEIRTIQYTGKPVLDSRLNGLGRPSEDLSREVRGSPQQIWLWALARQSRTTSSPAATHGWR